MVARTDFVLSLSTGACFKLVVGQRLGDTDITGLHSPAAGSAVALVSANPKDPSVLGLTNLSTASWTAEIPGKGPVSVPSQKSVRLDHGVRITFGSVTGVIEDALLQGSVVVTPGWRLRVTRGPLAGQEYALGPGSHRVGRGPGATVVVPHPFLEPEHFRLDVVGNEVIVQNLARTYDLRVGGQPSTGARLGPGDEFEAGQLDFKVVNQALGALATGSRPWLSRWPAWVRVGLCGAALASLLFVFLALEVAGGEKAPKSLPVTLLAMSAVFPAMVMTYLVERHNQSGISYKTLGVTFLLGGTLGLVTTYILHIGALMMGLGALVVPVLAGLFEEPAKLIATSWRWKHPAYDKPMDGLIIGTMSGFGFAVFETAGYGYQAVVEGGLIGLLAVQVIRGLLSPFMHGLWTGITCAGFWECDRTVSRAVVDGRFVRAMLSAIVLHALWNAGWMVAWPLWVVSGVLGLVTFRHLLRRRGYSTPGYLLGSGLTTVGVLLLVVLALWAIGGVLHIISAAPAGGSSPEVYAPAPPSHASVPTAPGSGFVADSPRLKDLAWRLVNAYRSPPSDPRTPNQVVAIIARALYDPSVPGYRDAQGLRVGDALAGSAWIVREISVESLTVTLAAADGQVLKVAARRPPDIGEVDLTVFDRMRVPQAVPGPVHSDRFKNMIHVANYCQYLEQMSAAQADLKVALQGGRFFTRRSLPRFDVDAISYMMVGEVVEDVLATLAQGYHLIGEDVLVAAGLVAESGMRRAGVTDSDDRCVREIVRVYADALVVDEQGRRRLDENVLEALAKVRGARGRYTYHERFCCGVGLPAAGGPQALAPGTAAGAEAPPPEGAVPSGRTITDAEARKEMQEWYRSSRFAPKQAPAPTPVSTPEPRVIPRQVAIPIHSVWRRFAPNPEARATPGVNTEGTETVDTVGGEATSAAAAPVAYAPQPEDAQPDRQPRSVQREFDDKGFDRGGFGRDGFNAEGYNRAGYDRSGLDRSGLDRGGFGRDGFNRDGRNRDGFDRAGFDRDGFDRGGFHRSGFSREGRGADGTDLLPGPLACLVGESGAHVLRVGAPPGQAYRVGDKVGQYGVTLERVGSAVVVFRHRGHTYSRRLVK
ncbi:MAG: PrsW family intramembrane metalloprotease [Candidatus Riflebacteria bacterium]|nr:PrsW family intramembrane metalloprotease [Candidatus Riflebacteria bacterium]